MRAKNWSFLENSAPSPSHPNFLLLTPSEEMQTKFDNRNKFIIENLLVLPCQKTSFTILQKLNLHFLLPTPLN